MPSASGALASEFTFSEDAEPLACLSEKEVVAAGGETFTEQLRKWGFSVMGTAPAGGATPSTAHGTVLARYHYAAPSSSAGASSALHFHDGLVSDLLHCFFATPCVQQTLPWCAPVTTGAQRGVVRFVPLTCRWTSLQPLEDALVCGKVVRSLRDLSAASGASESEETTPRLLLVKRPEAYLPHGLCVADELRALCLLPTRLNGSDGQGTEEAQSDDDSEEEDDDWTGGAGRGLTRRELRAVVPREEQRELLFQLVRVLAIGGGAMNQYEDYLDPYVHAARALYRTCVTSLQVREVLSGEAVTTAKRADVASIDDDDDGGRAPRPATAETRDALYVPTIASRAFEITHVGGQCVTATSPMNFCVVIVNPLEQTVVLFCHKATA